MCCHLTSRCCGLLAGVGDECLQHLPKVTCCAISALVEVLSLYRMGKKQAGAAKAARRAVAGDPDVSTSSEQEPTKLNLYDSGALKNALDDYARQVIFDCGYDEDVSVSNVKIALGLLAIGTALYSQFGPGKFPDNWWMVLGCVVVYVVLTITLYLFSWKHEGDAFYLGKPKKGQQLGIRVSSGLERFGEQYTLVVSDGPSGAGLDRSETWDISELFHSDGYLAEQAVRERVTKLVEQWEAAQHQGQGSKAGAGAGPVATKKNN